MALMMSLRPAGQIPGIPRVAVLSYHDVSEHPDTPYVVTPQRLERDLRWLRKNGWKPIRLQAFRRWMDGEQELRGKFFLVTFDDGYAGVASEAAPVLERLRIPATAFIITAHLGPVDPAVERAKLTPDQVGTLARRGLVNFGSHTHDMHRCVLSGGRVLPAVFAATDAELGEDLDRSVRRLEALTGSTPLALAWPYGEAPVRATAIARKRFSLVFVGGETFVKRGHCDAIPRFFMERKSEEDLRRIFF